MALAPNFSTDEIPRMFYGTAWKEERSAELTQLALNCGFRAIDTANQRKHYFEEGVGQGIQAFQADQNNEDSKLFLQTKFTFLGGQDQRLPYDPDASIGDQVRQSFLSSQQHLGVDKIDSLVLHGPMYRSGLSKEDWEAWRAMEALAQQGQVRFLGISNISAPQLKLLLRDAKVPPRFVQNRCFAVQGWDREVRQICEEQGSSYQGFSLLTANRQIFADTQLRDYAKQYRCTTAQLVYSFTMHLGMIVLTGTTNEQHIREALQSLELNLDPGCVEYLENIAG